MYDHVAQNQRRSLLPVVSVVLAVAVVVGAVLALLGLGIVGVAVAIVIAGGWGLAAHRWSDAVVLRLGRAEPADPVTHARLHNLAEGLCVASGLPMPRLHVIDDVAPNAFVTGRSEKHAALAVTTGLLEQLDRVELEAVLAHELSHVKGDDILVPTLAVTTLGLPTLVADLCLRMAWRNGGRQGRGDPAGGSAPWLRPVGAAILVLSPALSALLRAGAGPRRVAMADLAAVEMTRYPPGLISALETLRDDGTVVAAGSRAAAHLWLAVPLARVPEEGELSARNRLFDSHPPLEERIATLREL